MSNEGSGLVAAWEWAGPSKVRPAEIDPFAKLERAQAHLAELKRAVAEFEGTQPYHIEAHEEGAMTKYCFRQLREPPKTINLIAGDAVHNARAALDHMAAAFVKRGGGNINHAGIPIQEVAEGIKGKIRKKLHKASAEAKLFVLDLKPYKGGNDDLYLLHSLDVADKHRQIAQIGAANISITQMPKMARGPNFVGEIPFLEMSIKSERFVSDGDNFFAEPAMHKDMLETHFSISIGLADVDGMHIGPMIPTIAKLIQFVERVLNDARDKQLI